MRFDSFMGGSYESQSYTADQERTVNLYPELLESDGATQKRVLYPTPGVVEIADASAGSGRGHFSQGGREFAVIGTAFLEIDAGGTLTNRGSVALDSHPATISSNGDGGGQLFVTSGSNGYIFDLTANTLSQVSALDGKATMGDMLDGYFLALDAGTSTMYRSKLLDGLTWDTAQDFDQRSLASDRWLSMKVLGRIIWLLGEFTSETWFDQGALNQPFVPTPSGLIPYGVTAPFSAAIIGEELIWIGATRSGRKMVLRAQGTTPEIISSKPLESAFDSYIAVADAVGDVYSERGHTFYLISFDQNDITWSFDTETKLWCERGTWVAEEDRFVSWRPRFYASAFGEHRILDSAGGKVYRMSADLATDVDGRAIKRVRRAPAINNELQRVFYPGFELDLELGIANSPTLASFTMAEIVSTLNATYTMAPDPTQISVNASTSITFTSNVTPGVPGYTYDWDWGDGTAHSTAANPSHTFNTNVLGGTYTTILTVTDAANVTVHYQQTFNIAGS